MYTHSSYFLCWKYENIVVLWYLFFQEWQKCKQIVHNFNCFENIKKERILQSYHLSKQTEFTYFNIKCFAFFLNSSFILKSFSSRMCFDVHCSGSTDGIGIVNVFVAILKDILADFFDGSCVDSRWKSEIYYLYSTKFSRSPKILLVR